MKFSRKEKVEILEEEGQNSAWVRVERLRLLVLKFLCQARTQAFKRNGVGGLSLKWVRWTFSHRSSRSPARPVGRLAILTGCSYIFDRFKFLLCLHYSDMDWDVLITSYSDMTALCAPLFELFRTSSLIQFLDQIYCIFTCKWLCFYASVVALCIRGSTSLFMASLSGRCHKAKGNPSDLKSCWIYMGTPLFYLDGLLHS